MSVGDVRFAFLSMEGDCIKYLMLTHSAIWYRSSSWKQTSAEGFSPSMSETLKRIAKQPQSLVPFRLCTCGRMIYCIAGKFGRNLIWQIGLNEREWILADFRISELDLVTPQILAPAHIIGLCTYKAPVTTLSSIEQYGVGNSSCIRVHRVLSMFGLQQLVTNYPVKEK